MADIFHCLRMNASPDDLFRAVTEKDLLRPWWATGHRFSVQCVDSADGARVAWRCTEGPPEWIGTEIAFAFAREDEDGETTVRLSHKNWRETSDAFARCTTKWGRVLLALKSRVETPEADDLRA